MSERMKSPNEMRESAEVETEATRWINAAETCRVLMHNDQVRSRLNPEDIETLEQLENTWDVDVLGKLRAYANGKPKEYANRALRPLNEAGKILSAAIDRLVDDKLHEWGVNLDDDATFQKLQSKTQTTLSLLCSRIIDGRLSLDDIDTVVADVAAEISDPKKE